MTHLFSRFAFRVVVLRVVELVLLREPRLGVLVVRVVRRVDGAVREVVRARLALVRRLLRDRVVRLGALHDLLLVLLHQVAAVALRADGRRALPARLRPRGVGDDGDDQHDAECKQKLVHAVVGFSMEVWSARHKLGNEEQNR